MPTFYSPNGNIEVWHSKPNDYYTIEEWLELNPPEEPEIIDISEQPKDPIVTRLENVEDILLGILKGEINV